MAATDPVSRGRQSLWTIFWLHVIVAVVFMVFAFFLLQRQQHRQADMPATQAAYAQKLAAISSETDIESLRLMAQVGWQHSDKYWQLIDGTWDLLTQGFTCLPVLPLGTACIAWWGLRRKAKKPTPA